MRWAETPDRVIDHVPNACHRCDKEFPEGAESQGRSARQVHDTPEQKLDVEEHRVHSLRCDCGAVTEGTFPEGVKARIQQCPRLTGIAVYLHAYQHLPLRRNAQAIKDMFGIAISEATVAAMTERVARSYRRAVMLIGFYLARFARVKNLDETGFPVAGRTMWVHVLCDALQTVFRLDEKRSAMFEGLTGILVHDRWGYCFLIPDVVHALCNSHIMRDLLAVEIEDREPWARKMRRLLLQVCLATWLARNRKKEKLPEQFLAMFERIYVRILDEAKLYHKGLEPFGPARDGKPGRKKRRPGLNLAEDLLKRKDEFLRFAHDLSVPFSNNQAEQDIRMCKLQPKISGCYRTRKGAAIFLRLRSIANTGRKRGWDVIEILGGSPEKFIEALDYPAEVLDAFETYLKGEGVDVEELDIVDKKDKAARQS